MRRVIFEALIVAVLGAALSFAANALSPKGLKLNRDFFTTHQNGGLTSLHTNALVAPVPGVPANLDSLKSRLQAKGMQLGESNRVVELFRDSRREQGLVVFIDARDESHFQEGHIPGAYQFDYYRAENYLATILPVCQAAELILIYCNGGNCEDSELAATFLASAGIPAERLIVYAGGMTEWLSTGLPVETGARLSGEMRTAADAPHRKGQ